MLLLLAYDMILKKTLRFYESFNSLKNNFMQFMDKNEKIIWKSNWRSKTGLHKASL